MEVLTKVLDDLSNIYVVKVSPDEQNDIIKCCFDIEKMHWHYVDNISSDNEMMPKMSLNEFAVQIFSRVPFLSPHLNDVNDILEKFELFKRSIPTCGAVLLSEDFDHVLLVQTSVADGLFGFPKGKLDGNENHRDCAIREVLEETGYNIKKSINPEWFIEGEWSNSSQSGHTRLYIIPNVPMHGNFAARTKGEIKCCKWIKLDQFFRAQRGKHGRDSFKVTSHAFFMKEHLHRFLSNTTQFEKKFKRNRSSYSW